jgi:pyruvate carboxylase
VEGRPGESLKPLDFDTLRTELREEFGKTVREVDVISASLYPKVTKEYLEFKEKYGPVDALDTKLFLVGPKVAQEFEVGKT